MSLQLLWLVLLCGAYVRFEVVQEKRKPWVPSTCASDLRKLLSVPLRSQGHCGVGRGLSELHWVRCNGRGPDKLRQEPQGSSPGFECAGSDSDRRVPAELGQESQASSCVEFSRQEYWSGVPLPPSTITSWQIDGETVADFILGASKITADGDCSHETKRCLLLGRKVMINLDSMLKSRDITLPIKLSSQSYGFSSSHVWM